MTFASHIDFARRFGLSEIADCRWENWYQRHCRIGRITLKEQA